MNATDSIIKQAGLKVTPQRRLVYEAMMQLRHATIDEIIAYIGNNGHVSTLSTIYRILDSFCEVHLLTVIFHPDSGKCYYDITVNEHHHVFDGGKVIDFKDAELTDAIRLHLEKHGFDVNKIDKIQVQIITNK